MRSSRGCKRSPSPQTTDRPLSQSRPWLQRSAQRVAQPAAFRALQTADGHGEGEEKGGCVNV